MAADDDEDSNVISLHDRGGRIFRDVSPPNPTLLSLLDKAKGYKMTPEEREAQRRSFAYGNASMSNPNVTRKMVDQAAEKYTADDVASYLEKIPPWNLDRWVSQHIQECKSFLTEREVRVRADATLQLLRESQRRRLMEDAEREGVVETQRKSRAGWWARLRRWVWS